MAVKRRVIWMDDEEWQWMRDKATAHGMTISALVRASVVLAPPMNEYAKAMFGQDKFDPEKFRARMRELDPAWSQSVSEIAREPIPLEGWEADDPRVRFNTQPFQGPIPKKR